MKTLAFLLLLLSGLGAMGASMSIDDKQRGHSRICHRIQAAQMDRPLRPNAEAGLEYGT
jgi:hypothetical protein